MGRERSDMVADASGQLERALVAAGWRIEPADDGAAGPDLAARRGDVVLAAELKVLKGGSGAARLIPAWSEAWLRAKANAPRGHTPVAIVVVDRVGSRAAHALMQFMAETVPDALGGAMDSAGVRRFHGPLLEELVAGDAGAHRGMGRAGGGSRNPINLFSDLNQWMLKVLLAPEIPEAMLRAPRDRYRGPSDLARAAEVTAMSASRLIRRLRKEGYLDESARYLRLVRRADLMRRWQSAVAVQPVVEQGWRAMLRVTSDEVLDRWLATYGGCLALFTAAQAYKLGFVEGVPHQVYEPAAHEPDSALSDGWVRTESRDVPDLVVRKPNAPESTFRGTTTVDGRAVADIVQVWLDVGAHPTRGREQADLIWQRVLGPVVGSDRDA